MTSPRAPLLFCTHAHHAISAFSLNLATIASLKSQLARHRIIYLRKPIIFLLLRLSFQLFYLRSQKTLKQLFFTKWRYLLIFCECEYHWYFRTSQTFPKFPELTIFAKSMILGESRTSSRNCKLKTIFNFHLTEILTQDTEQNTYHEEWIRRKANFLKLDNTFQGSTAHVFLKLMQTDLVSWEFQHFTLFGDCITCCSQAVKHQLIAINHLHFNVIKKHYFKTITHSIKTIITS